MKKSTGILLAAVSAAFCGTYGMFTIFLSDLGLKAATIAIIAPSILFVFSTTLALKRGWRNYKLPTKVIPAVLLYGFFCAFSGYSAVKAYTLLPIAVCSIIIYCDLFLIIISSRILFHDKLTKTKIIACAAAIAGISMVVNIFDLNGSLSFLGLLWAGIAMCCWAGIVICEKFLLNAGITSDIVLSLNGFFAVLFLSLFSSPPKLITNLAAAFTAHGWTLLLVILAYGVFTEILCYYLYMMALKRLEPALVSIAWTMDPVTTCVLGLFIFGQILAPIQIVGIVVILAIVIWLHWEGRKEERASAHSVH